MRRVIFFLNTGNITEPTAHIADIQGENSKGNKAEVITNKNDFLKG